MRPGRVWNEERHGKGQGILQALVAESPISEGYRCCDGAYIPEAGRLLQERSHHARAALEREAPHYKVGNVRSIPRM